MDSIKLTAPAKVNIFLRVLSKRKDSYHNIFTLFNRVSLADEITISKIRRGISISCDKFITSDPRDNLVYKAAELVMAKFGIKEGVRIRLKKKVPIAAGLGGGSSDAASVIMGIPRLFRLKADSKSLISIAKKVGSDVAFFILNKPFALGMSKGDELMPVSLDLKPWHLIIYPNFKVITKEIYRAFDLSRGLTRKPGNVKISSLATGSIDFDTLESMLYNDLEAIVLDKKKDVGSIIKRLATSLGKKAIVSGSGPSVFCLYRGRKEAIEAKKKLFKGIPAAERKGWQVFVTKTQS